LYSQCYNYNVDRIQLFSPFLNNNPRFKKKIPTEYFGDSSRRASRLCNGRGIIHVGNGYYLDIGESVFAPISGLVHIYTLGSSDVGSNTKTGLWIDGKTITVNFQGLFAAVTDGQYVYKGQVIGKGFDNYGEAGVYFSIRNAPAQNPTSKRSFLPVAENPLTPCKCNNEPVFPEYFVNPEMREIDYNEYNEILPEGEVSVHIEPSGIGQWSFDGGETWHNSGTVIKGLPLIYYKVIFRNEFGYTAPYSMSYTLSSSQKNVILSANYKPDYSILPKPKALIQKEQNEFNLERRLQEAQDSIHTVVISSVNNILSDTIKKIQQVGTVHLLDSLNRRYGQIEEIQKRQLEISQIFKVLLPIVGGLMLISLIFWVQNQKIKKQKKVLELMQKEQHHRVHNNLGIIAGLVFDYGKEIGEEKINNLRNSILAMSKVHSELYKHGSLELIQLNNLFSEIANTLVSQANKTRKINCEINCNVEISQTKATKLALIINELLTNSIKYASKENGKDLKLKIDGYMNSDTNEIIISYSDNGLGYSIIPDIHTKIGVGTILCYGLIKELGGQLKFYNSNGACCLIKLKP